MIQMRYKSLDWDGGWGPWDELSLDHNIFGESVAAVFAASHQPHVVGGIKKMRFQWGNAIYDFREVE